MTITSKNFKLTGSEGGIVVDVFYVRVTKVIGESRYWAFLKNEPFRTTNEEDPFCRVEPAPMYFGNGITEMDALANVFQSMSIKDRY